MEVTLATLERFSAHRTSSRVTRGCHLCHLCHLAEEELLGQPPWLPLSPFSSLMRWFLGMKNLFPLCWDLPLGESEGQGQLKSTCGILDAVCKLWILV